MSPVDLQQSLRQRLLLAISTGALLAGPGCGGNTSLDPDDTTQPSGGTNGAGAGGSGSEATTSTTGPPFTEGTTAPGPDPGGVSTTGTAKLSCTEATGSSGGSGSGGVGSVSSAVGIGFTATTVGTSFTSTSTTGTWEHDNSCDPGRVLREFCLTTEGMEDQARYGVRPGAPKEVLRCDDEIAAGYDENGCMRHDWIVSGCCAPTLGPGIPFGDECCYVACEGSCCGRPLVLGGQAITAPVASRSDWVTLKPDALCGTQQTTRTAALAELWQADALAEHASVASFARFTLQLLALGAPSELLREAQLAALDEIDHARRCFDIASRLSGRLIGPGRLAEASANLATDLAEVVVATIHEGCVGETLAAAMASEQARVAEDPEVRESLLKIAEDEARHAELAWRFVAWAMQRADARVRHLAHEAFRQALARSEWPLDPARLSIDPRSLHAWGQLSPEESKAVARQTLTGVVSPAAQRLLASRGALKSNPPSHIGI